MHHSLLSVAIVLCILGVVAAPAGLPTFTFQIQSIVSRPIMPMNVTGNLTIGANGNLSLGQWSQTFNGRTNASGFTGCPFGWYPYDAGSGTSPGSWGFWSHFLGKWVVVNSGTSNAWLVDQCAGGGFSIQGYDSNATMHVGTQEAIIPAGAIFNYFQIGLGNVLQSSNPTCGAVGQALFSSSGTITGWRTGVSFGASLPAQYGATTTVSPAIPANAWVRADVWSNGTGRQAGILAYNGVSYFASSSFTWYHSQCQANPNNQRTLGAAILVTAGGNAKIGFSNATDDGHPLSGYYATASSQYPGKLLSVSFTYLSQPYWHGAKSGGLCPCTIRSGGGSGLVVASIPSLSFTPSYSIKTTTVNVTMPASSVGIPLTLLGSINATDGLATSFISGISFNYQGSYVWTNPGGLSNPTANATPWIAGLLFVMLCGVLFFSIFEAYREKFAK